MHISQSGVSAQVRQLERELGADLIDRSTRSATLTRAGVAALGPARAALAAAASVCQTVDDVNQLMRGQLVIAMVTACTVTPFFDALAAFHLAHPGVEITLTEDSSDRMVQQVRAGLVDLALVGCAAAPPTGLDGPHPAPRCPQRPPTRHASLHPLERWQTTYLPIFALWATAIVVILPPAFGFD